MLVANSIFVAIPLESSYNIHNMTGATTKLRTIVELLIDQATDACRDYFRYDYDYAKNKFKETGDLRFNLKPKEQKSLLVQLDKMINVRLKENGLEDIMDYVWKLENGTYEWVHYCSWVADFIEPNFAPYDHEQEVYVHLDSDAIDFLRRTFEFKVYTATLHYYSGEFTVFCNDKIYTLKSQLDEDNINGKIMKYAWSNLAKKLVTKKEVADYLGMKLSNSLESYFQNTHIITETLKPFIRFSQKAIWVKNSTKLTSDELERIAKASDVSQYK